MKKSLKNHIESYINEYLGLWDFFGVIQVIQKGKVIYEKSSGYACLEFGIKNSIQTRFSLASMSKQFTAFAIMILYDKHLIDIDKPANLYLPIEMQISNDVSVHNLLSHTSGLYNFYNFESDFFGDENRLCYSKFDYFNQYVNQEPTDKANTRFDYNNSNYNLLAWIIEYISGMSYDDFLTEAIFKPLGMNNSFADNGDKIISSRAFNYLKDFDRYIKCPYYNEKFNIGAGSIVSTCEDLYKWYLCLKNKKLLSKEIYSKFLRENMNGYCYGLEYSYIYGVDRYSHGGDHLAMSTYMQNFFDEDICIIILANNESINQYRLGNCISDILHDVDVDAPSRHKEITVSETELNKYCGTYLKDKIKLEIIDNKIYFTRFKENLHIEMYPVDEGKFVRRHTDQKNPSTITFDADGHPWFFGYIKQTCEL